jgi:hypothetical protein
MSSNIHARSGSAVPMTGASANKFSGCTVGEETWLTPRYIIDELGPFDLDPATPPKMPWGTATRMLTEKEDGLATFWPKSDFVWHNPPYGRGIGAWMKKMADHGNGISLIFARTETASFQQYVWRHPNTSGVFFFDGRLKFCRPDGTPAGTAGAPSALVAHGKKALLRLQTAVEKGLLRGVIVAPPHCMSTKVASARKKAA